MMTREMMIAIETFGADAILWDEEKKEDTKMKVFKVWVDKVNYDEYDSMVVVAKSKKAVLAMGKHIDDGKYSRWEIDGVVFYDYQGKIHIEEVDLSKAGVVVASFNAG